MHKLLAYLLAATKAAAKAKCKQLPDVAQHGLHSQYPTCITGGSGISAHLHGSVLLVQHAMQRSKTQRCNYLDSQPVM